MSERADELRRRSYKYPRATLPETYHVQGENTMSEDSPILLDLDAIQDTPVDKGWHVCTIESASVKVPDQEEGGKKKYPRIFVLARLTDQDDPQFNRTLVWNLMLGGQGTTFTKRCLTALGYEGQLSLSADDLAAELEGQEIECLVSHRTYQGELQSQVNKWRTPQTLADLEL